jgi:hypothetical protein
MVAVEAKLIHRIRKTNREKWTNWDARIPETMRKKAMALARGNFQVTVS